jgi:hypothetical protein
MPYIDSFLHMISQHFGVLFAIFAGIMLSISHYRGELKGLIEFGREMLCGADHQPSSKNAGYFMGAASLCWAFTKVTLAICRSIDLGQLDPTTIFIVLVSAIAGLVGVVVLGASAIQARLQAKLQGPPDPPAQAISNVENLTQEAPK